MGAEERGGETEEVIEGEGERRGGPSDEIGGARPCGDGLGDGEVELDEREVERAVVRDETAGRSSRWMTFSVS